jgi:GTPase SAR1 family protein
VNPASYENVKVKWHPEVTHHCQNVPMILVGTKSDLKEDVNFVKSLEEKGTKIKTAEDAEELRKHVKAVKYVECSAKTQYNIKQVFDECIKVVLFAKRKPAKKEKSGGCNML